MAAWNRRPWPRSNACGPLAAGSVLVTGRQVDDLLAVFPEVALFDRVVAENGAVVYEPAGRVVHPLGEPPPAEFVTALRKHNVTPLSTGHVIVATWEPHETVVLKVIRELGLELQVIFNKGAVMVLPTGTNKATGLRRALADLGLAPHNTVGVGDAENDQAFLGCVECSVAVANALQSVKDRVDLVTQADHGKGVVELIDCLLSDDLQSLDSRLTRHQLLLGHTLSGEAPTTSLEDPAPGEAWLVTADAPPIRYRVLLPESDRRRHRRKYAEGELGPDKSFYFRGPDGRLNLRAQNLTLFTQLAEGVDDATWLHHLRQQDYSTWIRDAIKDDRLADIVLAVEQRADLLPARAGRKSWTRFMPSTRRRVEQPKRPD